MSAHTQIQPASQRLSTYMTSKLETKWDAQGTAPPDEAKTLSLGPIAPQDTKDTLKDRTEINQ